MIYDAVVAGCGPAGAVCAALLGSRDLRTLVVERSQPVYDKPRAFALDHEVMRVLQNIGVAQAVLPHTAPFTPSEYYGVDGTLIKRLGSVPPPWPQGWPPNLVFSQPPFEAALRNRLAELPSVTIAFDELTGLEQDEGTASVYLKSGKEPVKARYVIGCDGANSSVRSLLGIGLEDLAFDQSWLVVDLRVTDEGARQLPAVSIQYCEPQRPCTYLVGPGDHRRWEIMLLPGEDPRALEKEEAVWRLLARWISPAQARLWRSASYRFHALVAREWRRGRVFLAGDAAHQQPPFTGQGMCQGVRDAANLAWKLARVLRGPPLPAGGGALLDSYGAERGAHVRRLTATVKEIGKLIGERDPAAARARDAKLLAAGPVKTEPRQNLIPPLECGFLSPLPHPANGTLFPQPRLKNGLMDDVLGCDFRVVSRDAFLDLETEGVLRDWFQRNDCNAALVRPDHYVYGAARNAAELAQVRAAAAGIVGA